MSCFKSVFVLLFLRHGKQSGSAEGSFISSSWVNSPWGVLIDLSAALALRQCSFFFFFR